MDEGGSHRIGPSTASKTSLPCPEAPAGDAGPTLRAAGLAPAASHLRWLGRSELWASPPL
eukprot:12899549-Alexandrium_andersonii.AAC.1